MHKQNHVRKMFENGMQESQNCKENKPIELHGIDYDSFCIVLNFISMFDISNELTYDNIGGVCQIADMYQIDVLYDSCKQWIRYHLYPKKMDLKDPDLTKKKKNWNKKLPVLPILLSLDKYKQHVSFFLLVFFCFLFATLRINLYEPGCVCFCLRNCDIYL